MKRFKKLSMLVAAVHFFVGSQVSASLPAQLTAASASSVPKKIDKPFFYVVEKDGKQSYLFGTVHSGVSFKEIPDYVRNALESSQTAVFESLEVMNEKKMLSEAEIQEEMFDLKGKPLSQQLSKPAWEKLKKVMGPQVPEPLLERMRPLAIVSLLQGESLDELRKAGELDKEMHDCATKSGLHVSGLDEVQNMKDITRDMVKIHDLEKTLLESNDIAAETKEESAKLMKNYRSGDEEALHAYSKDSMKEDADMAKRMVTDRNKAWLPKIEATFKKPGSHFIAVGAGHLPGEEGLLKLLRNQGYDVNRIDSERAYDAAVTRKRSIPTRLAERTH